MARGSSLSLVLQHAITSRSLSGQLCTPPRPALGVLEHPQLWGHHWVTAHSLRGEAMVPQHVSSRVPGCHATSSPALPACAAQHPACAPRSRAHGQGARQAGRTVGGAAWDRARHGHHGREARGRAATEETRQVKKQNLSTQLHERTRCAGAARCGHGAVLLRESYPPVTPPLGVVLAGHEGCDAVRQAGSSTGSLGRSASTW